MIAQSRSNIQHTFFYWFKEKKLKQKKIQEKTSRVERKRNPFHHINFFRQRICFLCIFFFLLLFNLLDTITTFTCFTTFVSTNVVRESRNRIRKKSGWTHCFKSYLLTDTVLFLPLYEKISTLEEKLIFYVFLLLKKLCSQINL